MLQCMSPLLAQSGHADPAQRCPLSGAKRTLIGRASMSANDPKRTLASDAGAQTGQLGPAMRTTSIDFQYKIKSAAELHEQVAKESQLSRAA